MIHALWLIPAAMFGAAVGIFCSGTTSTGAKYDGEMYERDRQILLRRINRLEREIKALRENVK